jgi:hypothetical protein
MTEKEFKKKYGYEIVFNEDNKSCIILGFPLYPQSSNKSKILYQHLELASLIEGNAQFPATINYTQLEREGDEISMYSDFHFDGIYQLLKEEKLNPHNLIYLKPEIYYPERTSKLPNLILNLYEFDENGFFEIEDEYEFLEFSFVYYKTKQFTKKRIEIMKEMGLKTNEIVQIPSLSLILLEFDEYGILKPISCFNQAKKTKLENIFPQ